MVHQIVYNEHTERLGNPMAEWQPVDTIRTTTTDEARRLAAAATATTGIGELLANLPAVIGIMRRCHNGQPQAAAYDRESTDGANLAWCERHEQTVARCYLTGYVCVGVPPGLTSDPTGSAAVVRDTAAADLAELLRQVDRLAGAAQRVWVIANAYPATSAEVATADGPGGIYCASCWRDDRTHELVTLSPSGVPYYVGRCRWCGTFRASHGLEPPLALLRARHQGRRITTAMVDAAVSAAKANATGGKGKGKRKGPRR